jgi:Ca2+-binding RTX toxin-like protein
MAATLLVAVGLTTWLLPPTSAAASTCGFDAASGTVAIDVGVGETATIVRSGDAIGLNGTPCDTATVTNTAQVEVTTHQSGTVVLDLSGGPFAPGTSTTDDDPEIKFDVVPSSFPSEYPFDLQVLGTNGADSYSIGMGTGGGMIDMNAGEPTPDQDVSFHGMASLNIQGLDGNDDLWLGGGARVDPAALPVPIGLQLTLDAGSGDDRVGCGGGDGSSLAAGGGIDTIDCSDWGGWAAINLDDGAGGAGRLLYASGQILLSGFENVIGTPFNDILYGDANDNRIVGGRGNDVLNGFGGNDHLIGKTGADALLGRGEDDVLLGGPGADLLRGGEGVDLCRGGTGHDVAHTCE